MCGFRLGSCFGVNADADLEPSIWFIFWISFMVCVFEVVVFLLCKITQ